MLRDKTEQLGEAIKKGSSREGERRDVLVCRKSGTEEERLTLAGTSLHAHLAASI